MTARRIAMGVRIFWISLLKSLIIVPHSIWYAPHIFQKYFARSTKNVVQIFLLLLIIRIAFLYLYFKEACKGFLSPRLPEWKKNSFVNKNLLLDLQFGILNFDTRTFHTRQCCSDIQFGCLGEDPITGSTWYHPRPWTRRSSRRRRILCRRFQVSILPTFFLSSSCAGRFTLTGVWHKAYVAKVGRRISQIWLATFITPINWW